MSENFFAQFAPVDAPRKPAEPRTFDEEIHSVPHQGSAHDPHQGSGLTSHQSPEAQEIFDHLGHQGATSASDTPPPLEPGFMDPPIGRSEPSFSGAGQPKTFAQRDMNGILNERAKKITEQRRKRVFGLAIGLAFPSIALVCVTLLMLWTWSTGRLDIYQYQTAQVLESSSGMFGLTIDEVTITGRAHTDLEDVADAISAQQGQAILSVDPRGVKTRLETLPWVEQASVERVLPKGLRIQLVERQPIAIWQNNGIHRLIDNNGVAILGAAVEPFVDRLPIVTGKDAPHHTNSLITVLAREPELFEQTLAATRVGQRRWDITLLGEVVVKLPDQNMDRAWNVLAEAQRRGRLLDRDIAVVDLRASDRIIVTTTNPVDPSQVLFDPNSGTENGLDRTEGNGSLTDI